MKTLNSLFSLFIISISLISKSISYTPKTHSSIQEIGGSLLEIISNTDEINYENPNEQKTEINNLILKAEKKNQLFLETEIQNTNNDGDKIIHKPFPETTKKMRKWGLVTLAIFGTSFLLIRSLYNSVKNINKFFAKGVLSLSNQMLLLFIHMVFLIQY